MKFKYPKDSQNIQWTKHAKEKMIFYNLSQRQLLNLLSHPERQEAGVAPGTIALMQTKGSKKHPFEIWLMYQEVEGKKKIITAWRYPSKSPIGQPPFPPDVQESESD